MLFYHGMYPWRRVNLCFSYFFSLIERNWGFSRSQHSGWNREEVGPNPGVNWCNPVQEAHCPVPRGVCTACPQHFPHPLTCWPDVVIFCPGMFIYPPFSHPLLGWPEDVPQSQGIPHHCVIPRNAFLGVEDYFWKWFSFSVSAFSISMPG